MPVPEPMLIPELYSTQLAVQPQSGGAAIRAWTTGQILAATVVRPGLDGTVTLRIGSQEVQARTGLNLSADQSITVQVAQTGAQTVLRVMHLGGPETAADPARTGGGRAADSAEAALAQAWRQVLPRAGDWRPLLAGLTHTPVAGQGSVGRRLPPPVAAALQALADRIPLLERLLTAKGLKQVLADSGVFLERHLAQSLAAGTSAPVQSDLKAGLLRLLDALHSRQPHAPGPERPAALLQAADPAVEPGIDAELEALLRQTDAALAHVEQRQLAALTDPSTGPATWVAALPARQGNDTTVLELRIEGDAAGAGTDPADRSWSVWLGFELGALGPVQARISLRGGAVTVGLWAEQSATSDLFNRHLGELQQALRQAGLETSGLHCDTGRPPLAGPSDRPPGLVDEHA
jgi:hypothetical protein